VTDPRGVYVDATLGGGGHSAALLDALAPQGQVIGIDRDLDALAAAGARLAAAGPGRFRTVHGTFGRLRPLLASIGIEAVTGILLDLGVSSHQLDTPERGFSYQADGALDMRMDRAQGASAEAVVNTWPEADLRRLLRQYGEEPRARRLTGRIVAARPLETTAALAALIRASVPPPDAVKTLARVFQAIRIAVNGELEELEQILVDAPGLLKPGGRMAVISYHSLEDRRVKRFFRYGNLRGEPVRDLYGNLQTPWRELTRRPLTAGEAEVALNPRARSARLRLVERLAPPPSTP
jgi:16S rRNA (cytosine1402-N4)-methyltransferase